MFLFLASTSSNLLKLKINLMNSHNLLPLNHEFQSKTLTVYLEPGKKTVIEFRKVKMELKGELGSFIFELL